MKSARLEDMVKGWFVGAFSPTVFSTDACEVGVKTYLAGDHEAAHYHKIGTELTLVISGRIWMMGREWGAGDIVVVEPGEVCEFKAITNATNVVVKLPGTLNDKYLAE